MKIHGFLKAQDLIRAYFLHIKPRPFFALIGSILLIACIWIMIKTWPFQSWKDSSLALILLYLLLYFFLYMPYRCYSIAKKKAVLQEPFSWNFTNQKVYLSASGVNGELDWKHFKTWKQNKHMILLYDDFREYTIIPKRWFTAPKEALDFTNLLQEKLSC